MLVWKEYNLIWGKFNWNHGKEMLMKARRENDD